MLRFAPLSKGLRCLVQRKLPLFVSLALVAVIPPFENSTHSLLAEASTASHCSDIGAARFVCGVTNVEDYAPLYPSRWIIGSSLAAPGQVSPVLYLFNGRSNTVETPEELTFPVALNSTRFPTCPGTPDWSVFE